MDILHCQLDKSGVFHSVDASIPPRQVFFLHWFIFSSIQEIWTLYPSWDSTGHQGYCCSQADLWCSPREVHYHKESTWYHVLRSPVLYLQDSTASLPRGNSKRNEIQTKTSHKPMGNKLHFKVHGLLKCHEGRAEHVQHTCFFISQMCTSSSTHSGELMQYCSGTYILNETYWFACPHHFLKLLCDPEINIYIFIYN